VASEALSGTVYFEMGNQTWGNAKSGGALGADGKVVEVKQAYIDWIVPNTDLKLRMGIQGITLPGFLGPQVMDADVAGVTASYQFNENVAATLLWARPYNDNYDANEKANQTGNYLDNLDLFALIVPLTFDGVKVTPWAAYGVLGKNTLPHANKAMEDSAGYTAAAEGLLTPYYGDAKRKDIRAYGDIYMAGLTGEITMADPFRFAWDFTYAGLSTGEDRTSRGGWYGALLAEYKMDWGTPGLYAWYASGEDGDSSNGSERMIFLDGPASDLSTIMAGNGHPYIGARGCVLGTNQVGTWGVGVRVKDMSFVEGLKHTFRVNYLQGTNDKDGVKAWGADTMAYNLSTDEKGVEIGLTNVYQIYENLEMYNDISYISIATDSDIRKGTKVGSGYADAWNVNVSFVYSF
ncbi:MAG: outer membrane homotrimeric porin, partial [Desulfovibrionaceae bacterium]|nr:outer membrane homotrimeric porin [Desulfovibrionaceae bacterium]